MQQRQCGNNTERVQVNSARRGRISSSRSADTLTLTVCGFSCTCGSAALRLIVYMWRCCCCTDGPQRRLLDGWRAYTKQSHVYTFSNTSLNLQRLWWSLNHFENISKEIKYLNCDHFLVSSSRNCSHIRSQRKIQFSDSSLSIFLFLSYRWQ